MTYDWNNSIVRMERVWEELDFRVSHHDSGFELDAWDAPYEGEGAEDEGERTDAGSVLGATSIQESPDNLHQGREENG